MPLAPNVIAVLLNLLFFALALPLAMKQVPMQYLYGYRTAGSTKNEKCWYAANAAFALPVLLVTGPSFAAGAVMLGVRYGTDLPFWEYGFFGGKFAFFSKPVPASVSTIFSARRHWRLLYPCQ